MESNKAESKMDETNSDDPNGKEDFKRKLVLKMAKIKEKKQSTKLLQQLKAETGRDCEKLWKQMVHSTTLKLVNLLALNDVSEDVAPVLRLSPDDWLLFDMVLVHQIKNITKLTEFNKKLPQCINDLYQLVQNHQVEQLSGDELAKAWIRITLQYNKGGRQVSPMLLQRRWYHLKEMAREQVYNPAAGQDKAKVKLLHTLAIRYQKIVTQPFPKWQKLLKEKLVISPKHFVKILKSTELWKPGQVDRNWYLDIKSDVYDYFIAYDKKICNTDEKAGKDLDKTELETDTTAITLNSDTEIDDIDEIDEILQEKVNIMKGFPEELTKSLNNEFETHQNLQENLKICRELPEAILIDKFANNETNFKRKNLIQKYTSAKEWSTENGYDLKLLMKPLILTKKLDSMKIFEKIEYYSVKDKTIIDKAALESKPTFKRVSKNKVLRQSELADPFFLGQTQKMDCNQNNSDITQSSKTKLKSRLMQKSRKRTYSPGQLCSNPDFNRKLKKLTPDFFSSARNKLLLKECKPLTIDLDKQFEAKFINGMYIIVNNEIEKRPCNVSIKIEPMDTEEQSTEMHISSEILENNLTTKDESILSNGLLCNQSTNERRKFINLPSIDEIRKFNQSLLTAEVTPLRNATSYHSTISGHEEHTVKL